MWDMQGKGKGTGKVKARVKGNVCNLGLLVSNPVTSGNGVFGY